MAKMGDASHTPTPAAAFSKEIEATRSTGGRPAPVNFGVMSAGGGAKINAMIFDAAASKTASSPLRDSVKESYFHQLEKLYAQGSRPSEKNLTGWFAGRCYNYDLPGSPEGGLLVGARNMVGGDNGPLFPPKSDFRILALVSYQGVDVYDDITKAEESEVNSLVISDFNDLTTAVETDGALASKYLKGDLEFRIRQYDSFFIGNYVALKGDDRRKSGETFSMCYYFKKVH